MSNISNKPSYTKTDVILGKGQFSTVYKGYNDKNGESVAIKMPQKKQGKIHFKKELDVLKNLPKHINIIHVYDCMYNFECSTMLNNIYICDAGSV